MRILVISDTHIPVAALSLPPIVLQEAKKADCCFHAGDFIEYSLFQTLCSLTKTYAVCGNMDCQQLRNELPEEMVVQLEGVKIALTHGAGHPANLLNYIQNKFASRMEEIDIFVFGHSHCATDKESGGKIYFNPGSATDKVFTACRSYGILDISGRSITRSILKIE
ncbi:MAG: metallophosphoesterase [Candidatus Omnitrophica bacterium]|nr:metallophosphoesterase [Candidatus Omnitrophota bacterium]MBU2474102.1 metallophosphoesterase [Candidatus Omnitrophota bacterium]